jgi:hypothetical protein
LFVCLFVCLSLHILCIIDGLSNIRMGAMEMRIVNLFTQFWFA